MRRQRNANPEARRRAGRALRVGCARAPAAEVSRRAAGGRRAGDAALQATAAVGQRTTMNLNARTEHNNN